MIGALGGGGGEKEIAGAARIRGGGQQVHDPAGGWVEAAGWDAVAGELRAHLGTRERERIEDKSAQSAEVARLHHRPLRQRRNRRDAFRGLADPDALVIAEQERLIAPKRASDRAAEFVAPKSLFSPAGTIVEKRVGIELVIAQKLVSAAVKLIAPGLALNNSDGASCGAVLGRVVAGHHAHFLNRIDGRDHDDAVDPETAVEQAIDEIAVVIRVGAIDADLGIGAQGVGATGLKAGLPGDGARAKLQQLHERAAIQRRLEDPLVIDEGGDGGGLGLQQRGLGLHFDRFLDVADGELEIDRQGISGGELDAGAHEFLKTGVLDGDGDVPGRKRVRDVLSVRVGGRGADELRAFMDERHFGARDDRPGLVTDRAGDGAALGLRVEIARKSGDHETDGNQILHTCDAPAQLVRLYIRTKT